MVYYFHVHELTSASVLCFYLLLAPIPLASNWNKAVIFDIDSLENFVAGRIFFFNCTWFLTLLFWCQQVKLISFYTLLSARNKTVGMCVSVGENVALSWIILEHYLKDGKAIELEQIGCKENATLLSKWQWSKG